MTDIREGMSSDPWRETLSDPSSTLRPETPPGSELTLNEDGTATFHFGDEGPTPEDDFTANLAESMDPLRLNTIAMDLVEAIEVDKLARERRDSQYEEGLRRTGLGDDAPGGAPFPGASRTVHPMLTEATIDYAGRVQSELLPPTGPCKTQTLGIPTVDKDDRAERVSRHMNWQLTKKMKSAYTEFEIGFSQEPLAGVFYTKMGVTNDEADVIVVQADNVYRPWSDGDFYSLPRITHAMEVDKWTFESYVNSGLWTDVVDVASAPDHIDQTKSSSSNDRIIGRDSPTKNIDDVRVVFETSTLLALEGPDDDVLPYIVTIDEQTNKVLAIYRNWDEDDSNCRRLDFLIEWPFQPWRGMPIGLAHMIGGLSGAATGSLRAILDSAFLNATQTAVKLKGGITGGGQNIRANPGQMVEVQGSLAQDPDIRKTYMPLEFPPPSEVLMKLLAFLVDAGRSVVRTTFDEFTKMNQEMPVGTANMMIEQGLKTFGAVFARQHRSMERFLEQLYYYNSKTVQDEQIVDHFGELFVTKADYQGPMCVVPVSDPRIFTDAQRMAQGQLVASRAQAWTQAGVQLYDNHEAELNLLRSAKVPNPERFLPTPPKPVQMNAAAENTAVTQGMPIKAFPGQDHEAHVAVHAAFIQSPLFGSNPSVALKVLPPLVQHLSEHISLWYADATLLAANAVIQDAFGDPRITLDALQTVKGLEVQLDRLIAEITPSVMQHANETLQPVMGVIQQAQQMIKSMQPPQPMDPSVVAQQDVQRQEKADQAQTALKGKEIEGRQQTDQARTAAQMQKDQSTVALKAQEMEHKAEDAEAERQLRAEESQRRDLIAAAGVAATHSGQDTTLETAHVGSATQLEIADRANDTKIEVAEIGAKAQKEAAAGRPKPTGKS